MTISIGIITHKDVRVVELIQSVLQQVKEIGGNAEVFVVSSGLHDGDRDKLDYLMGINPNLKIIDENARKGKAYSVNIFLRESKGEILVLISGDLILEKCSLSEILKLFDSPNVGMVGSHPLPLNSKDSFIGFAVNLMWEVHHNLSLIRPKTGEFCAFRRLFDAISPKTPVDEAWIESLINEAGLEIRYAPNAITYNMGPQTVRDYINQRKRIHIGHVDLKLKRNYKVASMEYLLLCKAVLKSVKPRPKEFVYTVLVSILELYIRICADYELFILKKNPYIWSIIETAKFNKKK
ncbi:MAG: glycosyltransferase family 2 protein [Candidatus Altiarchaeota archaeon]|nr:glycosyltransferase family 2 protein [Candidatus Altiarchaeota archaeon]